MKPRILYVEDDLTLSFVTKDNLEMQGYSIEHCENGVDAIGKFQQDNFDLCIFDVMLPKMDGFELAKKIREQNEQIPIIFLTAKSTKEDKIHGLKLGADDYITKPFSIEELVLKIKVFLKRSNQHPTKSFQNGKNKLGHFVFDSSNHQLIGPTDTKQLTQRESELLQLLCEKSNTILKRDDILRQVWGDDHYFGSRSLNVFISRLRKYLASDTSIKIENVHNVGYRLKLTEDLIKAD